MDKNKKSLVDILKIRILRTGRLTLFMASVILIISVLVFNVFASSVERMMYMANFGDNILFKFLVWMLRYGIALIIVGYYTVMDLTGEWDLHYKLIVRHKLQDKKYIEIGKHYEKIRDIQIFTDKKYKSLGMIALLKVYELEKQKSLFAKINNHYMALRDIDVQEMNADVLVITKYKYIGKQLVTNNNLYAYSFKIIKGDDALDYKEIGDIELDYEYSTYFRNCMERNEIDLKDSLKEDMKVGMQFFKKGAIVICFLFIAYNAVNFYRLEVLKKMNEAHGIVVESTIEGVKVLFDDPNDTWLMPHINSSLVQVNPNTLKKFVAEGWKIKITSENMESNGFYFGWASTGSIAGATSFSYKYLIIPNNLDSVDASVIHELGHFIDHWHYTMTDEWINIYHTEKENYLREYAKVNQFEGFACAYMEYVIVGESLKQRAPQTYEFIDRIMKNEFGSDFRLSE